MEAKQIVPCLDIRDGRVVKGINFEGIQEVDDPVVLAEYYNRQGADELVFYDITASLEGRGLFCGLFKQVAEKVDIPLMAGGGVNQLEDFERVLGYGADRVSVNSGALADPALVKDAVKQFGSHRVVLSVDVKQVGGRWNVFRAGGRQDTGIDALEWAAKGEAAGVGALVINSINQDGVKNGFDLPLLRAVTQRVKTPVIASGGAGNMQHFVDVFGLPGICAGLAASVFHYKEVEIPVLKRFLAEKGIPVNLEPSGRNQ